MSVAFCRYLLEHNRLAPRAFLEAIDLLRGQTPTLPRLVLDHQLLDPDTMLAVFAHQAEHRLTFEASCKALGHWSEALEGKLSKILSEAHPSIFHILLDRQLISPQDLIAAMDDFLAGCERSQKAETGDVA